MKGERSHIHDDRSAEHMALVAGKGGEHATEIPGLMLDVPLYDYMTPAPDSQRRFVMRPYFPRGALTLMGGHGGLQKSTLMEAIVGCLACDVSFGGHESDSGEIRSAYIQLEDSSAEFKDRLRKITLAYGLDDARVMRNVRLIDGSATDGALAYEDNEIGVRKLNFTLRMEQVEEAAHMADLVVIDGASDAFQADENSRRQVRAFLRRLTQIAMRCDCAIVLIVHIDKVAARHGSQGESYTGSTAWHNTPRSRIALARIGKTDDVELRHEKSNYGPCADPIILRRNEDGILVPLRGVDGDVQRASDEDAAVRLVRAATSSGVAVLCAVTGGHTGWHKTRHLPEAEPFADKASNGPQRLFVALEAAARNRRIRRVQDTDPVHRNTRDVWLPTETDAALNANGPAAGMPKPVNDPLNEPSSLSPLSPSLNARTRVGGARVHASKDRERH